MSDDRQLATRLRRAAFARYQAHLSPRIETWSLALLERIDRDGRPAALPPEDHSEAVALPSGKPVASADLQRPADAGESGPEPSAAPTSVPGAVEPSTPDQLPSHGAGHTDTGDIVAVEPAHAGDMGPGKTIASDLQRPDLAPLPSLDAMLDVTEDLTVSEAATAILLRHFASYQRRLDRVAKEGEAAEAESLRRLRISARRLRAGLRAFSEALPRSGSELRGRFGEIAGTLGAVRDLDVLAAHLAEWATDPVTSARYPLELLTASIAARQAAARTEALAALGSSDHRELLNDFVAFLTEAVEDEGQFGLQPLPLVAPQLVAARYWRIRQLGDLLRPDSPDAAYHRLRLRVKQLRDLLEFIAPVTGAEGQEMVERLIQLQDLLGRHQDACAAAETLRDVALNDLGASPQATFLVGQLAQRFLHLADAERSEFPAAYAAIRGKAWYRLERALDRAAAAVS